MNKLAHSKRAFEAQLQLGPHYNDIRSLVHMKQLKPAFITQSERDKYYFINKLLTRT